MAKPITLPFAEKTAAELASRLGVSKARQKRIFAIVEEHAKTTSAYDLSSASARGKMKSRRTKKAAAFNSQRGSRRNAKTAR